MCKNISLISELHPALVSSIRRVAGGPPRPLVACLVNKLFMTLANSYVLKPGGIRWTISLCYLWLHGQNLETVFFLRRIVLRWATSIRVCTEQLSINCPSEEAFRVTAVLYVAGGREPACTAIVCDVCGVHIFPCKFAESHAFHCLSWVAIKLRVRTLSLSKSKVSRQKVRISKATGTLTLWI